MRFSTPTTLDPRDVSVNKLIIKQLIDLSWEFWRQNH